jgi:NAD(P)-dependent dehydrogenase (short-subunit alcohol dehydrogenase family)
LSLSPVPPTASGPRLHNASPRKGGGALALLDLDGAHLAETAKRLPGTQSLTIAADVTDEAAVDDAFTRIAATHGRIDVLVNNVGGSRNQKLWEMTAEAWDFTIRLNLRSAFLCTRGRCG